MSQMQVWHNTKKGDDKLIVYYNNTIYKGSPKSDEIETTLYKLQNEKTTPLNLFGIPKSYIKEINLEEGKNNIEILFGSDSAQNLFVSDDARRNEIFEYLKANLPNAHYSVDNFSKLRAGSKPLIAMIFILIFFGLTLNTALGIENGYEYEIIGRYDSFAGIIVAFATFGVTKVILIFSTLLLIAVLSFFQKTRNPKIIHKLNIIR